MRARGGEIYFVPVPAARALRLLCAASLLALAAAAANAQAAKPVARPGTPAASPLTVPAPAPASPAEAEAAFAASRAAFDALSEADRRALQEALIWTGDFQGTATGDFGKRTRDALIAFETRVKNSTDGTIDSKELAKLLAAAQELKKAAGFAIITDPASGAQIGVPQKLLPSRSAADSGAIFAAAATGHRLALFALRGADADLAKQYEAMSAAAPERKVLYKLSRPDYFVVSGEAGSSKFYTRAARANAAGEAVLRGFTLTYPIASARDFNAVALAIANSFNPAPGTAAAAGKDAPLPPVKPPAAPLASVIATATLIAPGKAIAILPAGCAAPTAASAQLRLAASDAETGMALLDVSGSGAGPAPLSAAAITNAQALVIAGFGEGASGLSAAAGDAAVSGDAPEKPRVMAPVQPPTAGSAVFDRSGRFAGLIGRSAREPRRFAGVVPLMTHPLVALPAVLKFAGLASAPPSGAADAMPRSTGQIISAVRGALISVACPR